MDVETTTGGRDRTKRFSPEKRRMFHSLLHWDVGLGRPKTSPRMPMTSSNSYGRFGRHLRKLWHVWQLGEAQGGITFCSRRLMLP
jgi:hypothetical protein